VTNENYLSFDGKQLLSRLYDGPIVVRNIRCFRLWLVSRKVTTTLRLLIQQRSW